MKKTIERNHEIDIAKAILIYLVVVGHYFTDADIEHTYIFWFHMPAFIMISGLFIHDKISLKNELIKKTRRLIVPYFFFSILLGTFGTDRTITQQIMGTLIGADSNATPCTYPYYFVTQLFVAFIIWEMIQILACKNNRGDFFVIGVVISLYTFIQIIVSQSSSEVWGTVPWNMDMALVSVCFLCVGKYLKNMLILRRGGYIAIVVAFLLIVLQTIGYIDYKYNFRDHEWHWGLDIVIPYIYLLAILVISKFLDSICGVNSILRYIGNASLVIMFLHPFFQKVNTHFLYALGINFWVMSLFVVFECMVCYWIFRRYKYTKWIIGEKCHTKI